MDETLRLLLSTQSWVKYKPWERKGYCDDQGRCWFQQNEKWILTDPGAVVNSEWCLPAYAVPPSEAI
jgi:hypothetical protein